MAISRGFPPSNTISPSVRIIEKDLSYVTQEQSFHRAGLIGFASKGPINQPTLVSSTRDLHVKFGQPHPDSSDPYMIYAAEQYLLVANELLVVRVAVENAVDNENAETASVGCVVAGNTIVVTGSGSSPYTFDVDSFFRWKLNGVLASKTLVVLEGDYTVAELVKTLNDQLTPVDGILFVNKSGKLAVETISAYGPEATLEFVSVQDALYGPDSPVGFGTGMSVATTLGDVDRYPNNGYHTAGTFDLTGLTNLYLDVVVDGTDNVNVDNVVQRISLAAVTGSSHTIAQIVSEINGQITANKIPGGFEAAASGSNLSFKTLHTGRNAKVLVKSSSTAFGLFQSANVTVPSFTSIDCTGGSTSFGITAFGASCQGVSSSASVATFGIITGTLGTGNSLSITADSTGIDGNATQVVVANNDDGTFNIEVYSNGIQVESWGNLTKDQSNSLYVESYLAGASDYIRCVDNTATMAPPQDGTYQLTGGSDGIPSDPDEADSLLVGINAGYTGVYALSEPEQYDIDLIAIPGHSSTAVVLGVIDVAQNLRSDCLAIIDPPFGLTVKEIVDWQNGVHPLNNIRFDSDFAAVYWPWVKIYDSFNKIDIWAPPSGSVMATIARSDSIGSPWMAPAGETRGIVPGILDVFSRPTLTERDSMYGNRNAVNPIVQFSNTDSFVIWGQKTLQRKPTALDRINVRRLMFVIEKRLRERTRSLLFEPHDDALRSRFINIAQSVLKEIQVGHGVTAFVIKCDEELNTPDVVDRNEFRAQIGVQPTHAAEFMYLEFSIHRTGSFTQDASAY